MDNNVTYDAAIIGGGLAGLSLSILLRRKGFNVVLFEKESYPFHKVCGEYISMESWDFVESLGLPLSSMELPVIKKLTVTAPDGTILQAPLPLGGFGISRFLLDHELKKIAVANGVRVLEDCKVNDVHFKNEVFTITSAAGELNSKTCCGTFGKRSNLDIRWKRSFILSRNSKLNNYIGIKYHIRADLPADTISLHNFEHGYCGVSKIEDGKYCLCYLTNAYNLNRNDHSIPLLEEQVLFRNRHLAALFAGSERLFDSPVTISQVSFSTKEQVYRHVLLLGDAAGMITPLCGNGMSMALHSSKIAAGYVADFLNGAIRRSQMEAGYTSTWKKTFSTRIKAGMVIQHFFGKKWVTNLFVRTMKLSPYLTRKLIALTHGKPF